METFPLHKKVKHYKTTQKPSTLEENKKQQLPKQTEPHMQGQKMLFALNQYANDHGSINLNQMIKSILGMIN